MSFLLMMMQKIMEKLNIKYVAPYLPYGLKGLVIYSKNHSEICYLDIRSDINNYVSIDEFINGTYPIKPILRPLSDLTNEIEHNGEKFIPSELLWYINVGHIDYITKEREYNINKYGYNRWLDRIPFSIVQKLIEWHFDIYGLIHKKMAIDINTI